MDAQYGNHPHEESSYADSVWQQFGDHVPRRVVNRILGDHSLSRGDEGFADIQHADGSVPHKTLFDWLGY